MIFGFVFKFVPRDTILNHKDLNLPSQKEMLAIYRCDEETTVIVQDCQQSSQSFKKRVAQV